MELADREEPVYAADAPAFFSLVPLPELLSEILGVGPSSKEVMRHYAETISRFGSEFNLLLHTPLEEISRQSPLLGEAVGRVRHGRVIRRPGYDGEFGMIRVFAEDELKRQASRVNLFDDGTPRRGRLWMNDHA
jgi:PHP family Zn ribbon phosphoesterase